MCDYSGETADILQMAVAAPNFIQQNLHILCYVYRSTICMQCPGSKTLNRVTSKVWWCIRYPLGRERTYVSRYLCSPVPMFPEPMFPGAYVPRYLCSPVPMFPEPMFPGAYVPRYLCSPVPMFPDFCTLTVVISINRLQIPPTPWYDSRLGLCLGFRFRVLVRVRVRVRLELQTVFRLWLGCGLGLSLYS